MQALPATPDVGVKEFKVRIAAIVPCYNEEAAVGTVVTDLKNAVPGIEVYVYDNNSSDRTAEVAAAAGARRLVRGRVMLCVAHLQTSMPMFT